MKIVIDNLNELKGALENCTDSDLIDMREDLLKLVEESLNVLEEQ
jgi:hypothetical protein